MEFPVTLNDFLPVDKGTSKSKACEYMKKLFYIKISHSLNDEYFVEIIPEDKSIKDVAIGHNGNIYDIWSSALQLLDQRMKE